MTSVVFYFQVHQPYRLRRFGLGDVGDAHEGRGGRDNFGSDEDTHFDSL